MPTGRAALPVVPAALLLTAGCGDRGAGSADDGCPPTNGAAASSTGHRSSQDPSAVASYWTQDRMRSARPAPMPTHDGRACGS